MHSKRAIAIFLSIVVIALAMTNAAVFEAVARIFSIGSYAGLMWLAALLALLSIGFMGITIIGRRCYNWLTRSITRILSAYMGFFAYAFLASAVYGIIVLAEIPHERMIGGALMLLAALVAAYGFLNARRIRIVRIQAPFDAPQWRGRRAAFVSDLHLGQVLGPAFARDVVQAIAALEPDIVWIGGDLFDGTSAPDLDALIAPLRELRPRLGTFFVTGNHEEFGDDSPFLGAIERAGIVVLKDRLIEIDGLAIAGVDDSTCEKREDFARILEGMRISTDTPVILLRHQPKDLDVAEAAGISFQISGHTHLGQQWPFGYIAQWAFKGYAYGLKRFGAMHAYTSSGVGTWGPSVRVGTQSEIVEVRF